MCEMQKLRATVEQILTAAAEEIFGVFKRSIAEIQEELSESSKHNNRNRRLLYTEHQTAVPPEHHPCHIHVDKEDPKPPDIKEEQEEGQTMKLGLVSEYHPFTQTLWMVKEELHQEQQERSPKLDQMDTESPHIKEEENLWTNQEGEQLQGLEKADITKFPSTAPSVKSEYDEDEAQSSQLHHSQTEENTEEPEDRDDYGGSEPDRNQNNDIPISDVAFKSTQHQYTAEDKTCKFSSVLETQMTDDTTKKPFSCSVCKRCFVYMSKLKEHMFIHTGEKPFNCSVCQKGFSHKSKFKQHMSVHSGEKPFICSICKRGFKQKGDLNKHMLVHTGKRPFNCSVCNKGFARKSDVKQHMSVHTGEKPFSCSVCKKGFSRKSDAKQHMSVHTGEKPFSCSVCNKSFSHKGNLTKHMSLHTGKKYSVH